MNTKIYDSRDGHNKTETFKKNTYVFFLIDSTGNRIRALLYSSVRNNLAIETGSSNQMTGFAV